ncbi:MAG TPA: hypothetical protein V6C89_11585 [Drouetiella sp.]|jgi:hypothetical protein
MDGPQLEAHYLPHLVDITSSAQIPARWHGTPIEAFIQCQNLGYPLYPQEKPQILISACMEFRFALPVPARYAYVIRTPGGRLLGAELAVGYAISRGVNCILLMAHNDCGMCRLATLKPQIIDAFVSQGWSRAMAEKYFNVREARYSIPNELEALRGEYFRLKKLFLNVHVAPVFLTLADKRVYLPAWYQEHISHAEPNEIKQVADEDILSLS